jgi:DNA-binding MarR family transcriptional regulator
VVYLRESGRATQQKLAETMMMDANNCVILLNGLEDVGLIARTRDPEDRRRHIVEITPKGYKSLEKAERELETLEDEVLGKLDRSEREQLRDLLAKALEDHSLAISA